MAIGLLAPHDEGNYIVDTMSRSSAIRARIVAIGNSHGVRIPKPLLEQAGLGGEVELHAEHGRIVIVAPKEARAGWAEAAAQLHARGEDGVLETPAPTFDREEWEW
ncbi:MAG TPA: AbrB/MazE/SpoVT family DNA-binding domain-containing protein [Gemmatimonadaceae bacterium]|nr:AbrB/MazE/SpoVT family DNA-binding domain-containing protein [Gemmatimonadaceae bacterium]